MGDVVGPTAVAMTNSQVAVSNQENWDAILAILILVVGII